jgi:hypothetical protein
MNHLVTGLPIKLGRTLLRRNGKSRLRAAALHSFLTTLDLPPASSDNTFGITQFGMMLNDNLGDCTIAGPGHLVQVWTASSGKEVTVSDSVILGAYEQWDGYVDGNESTDNGGDILTVVTDWQANGLGGYGISAHAEVNLTQLRVQQGIYLFGGLNCGVNLPISAQSQVGIVWDVVGDSQSGPSQPGSWGGHCVAVVGYDAAGLTCVTWGALQKMTWNFFTTYFDEAVICLSPQWASPVALDELQGALQVIGN